MRGDELLDILEYVDPSLIEEADQKPKANWLRWTAVAACVALVMHCLRQRKKGLACLMWILFPMQTRLWRCTWRRMAASVLPGKPV